MNLPNSITLSRIALIPIFMFFWFSSIPYSKYIAAAIFIIASITDGVDGYIARKYNLVTNFGKFIDPLADKLLVTAALLMFVESNQLSSVAAMIIIAREFIVTSLRIVAISENVVIAAGFWGKLKTAVQISCIVAMFIPFVAGFSIFGIVTVNELATWLMVLVAVISGLDYIKTNMGVLKSAK